MNKAEILKKIMDAGDHENFRKTAAWVEAFEAYKKETRKSMQYGCHGCHREILRWLQA
jgi:hypothetical protein